jgi:hypothetical protein
VAPRRRDFQRALHLLLALYVGEISVARAAPRLPADVFRERRLAREVRDYLE